MPNLQFDDSKSEFSAPISRPKSIFDISGKLIEWGLVSDRQQAQYALIGIAVLALIAGYFVWNGSKPPVTPRADVAGQSQTQ